MASIGVLGSGGISSATRFARILLPFILATASCATTSVGPGDSCAELREKHEYWKGQRAAAPWVIAAGLAVAGVGFAIGLPADDEQTENLGGSIAGAGVGVALAYLIVIPWSGSEIDKAERRMDQERCEPPRASARDERAGLVRDGLCQDFGWKFPHPRGTEYGAAKPGR